VILAGGGVFTIGQNGQRARPLRASLGSSMPHHVAEYEAHEDTVSAEELRVAGMTSYLLRSYTAPDSVEPAGFSLYIGYCARQAEGNTIHSPKNCLPSSGWEPLASRTAVIALPIGSVTVNRYLIQNGPQRALVLYWYQGRVEADEFAVKWQLLRDAVLRRRSDEALVRLVVPIADSEDRAFATASHVATIVGEALSRALPP